MKNSFSLFYYLFLACDKPKSKKLANFCTLIKMLLRNVFKEVKIIAKSLSS